jgi:hypothetical protein
MGQDKNNLGGISFGGGVIPWLMECMHDEFARREIWSWRNGTFTVSTCYTTLHENGKCVSS